MRYVKTNSKTLLFLAKYNFERLKIWSYAIKRETKTNKRGKYKFLIQWGYQNGIYIVKKQNESQDSVN